MGIQHWKQDGIPVAELTGPEKRIVDAPSALGAGHDGAP